MVALDGSADNEIGNAADGLHGGEYPETCSMPRARCGFHGVSIHRSAMKSSIWIPMSELKPIGYDYPGVFAVCAAVFGSQASLSAEAPMTEYTMGSHCSSRNPCGELIGALSLILQSNFRTDSAIQNGAAARCFCCEGVENRGKLSEVMGKTSNEGAERWPIAVIRSAKLCHIRRAYRCHHTLGAQVFQHRKMTESRIGFGAILRRTVAAAVPAKWILGRAVAITTKFVFWKIAVDGTEGPEFENASVLKVIMT